MNNINKNNKKYYFIMKFYVSWIFNHKYLLKINEKGGTKDQVILLEKNFAKSRAISKKIWIRSESKKDLINNYSNDESPLFIFKKGRGSEQWNNLKAKIAFIDHTLKNVKIKLLKQSIIKKKICQILWNSKNKKRI